MKKSNYTFDRFVEDGNNIHNSKYEYLEIRPYVNKKTKIEMKCKHCGNVFYQDYYHHVVRKQGCPSCGGNKRKTTEEFINESKQIHGQNRYDYSKTDYKNCVDKVCLICHNLDDDGNEHGDFWVAPNAHLSRKSGCPKCYRKDNYSTEDFIKKARKVHKDKYDYSKCEYTDSHTKVCVICPEHGEFWQFPTHHLKGCGCLKCSGKERLTTEKFIDRSNKIHLSKYDYSKSVYKNNETKICIVCPKHGEFWQLPLHHMNGIGCPLCNASHLEREVMKWLEENKIIYTYQKTFDWLDRQSLDFYLSEYNLAIECQGEQHFKPVDFAGKGQEWAEKMFQKNLARDKKKRDKCLEHKINVAYVNFDEDVNNKLKEILQENVIVI